MQRQFYNTMMQDRPLGLCHDRLGVFGGGLTRRHFIETAAAAAIRSSATARVFVPVNRVMDTRAQCPREKLHHFWSNIWPEAVWNFSRGGIGLQTSDGPGEVRRSAGDKPIF